MPSSPLTGMLMGSIIKFEQCIAAMCSNRHPEESQPVIQQRALKVQICRACCFSWRRQQTEINKEASQGDEKHSAHNPNKKTRKHWKDKQERAWCFTTKWETNQRSREVGSVNILSCSQQYASNQEWKMLLGLRSALPHQ